MARARPDQAVLAAMLGAGLMLAQQVFGKATRDALFLSSFSISVLPRAQIAAAVLSLVAVLASSRAMTRYSPARVVPASFAVSAVLFLAEWALSATQPMVAAVAVYLHLAIFGAIVTSGFWSLVNERFDPHTARRVVGRIAAAGTVGSVVGGVLAWRVASVLSVPTMLAMLAGMNFVCVGGVLQLQPRSREGRAEPVSSAAPPSGFKVLREVGYLRQLALLVALCALSQGLLDFVLKDAVAARFEGGEKLVTFFALFHMSTGLISFTLQSTVSRPSLDRLGLAGTVALLPGMMVLAGFLCLLFPSLWSVILLCGIEPVLSTSLYRSGYELLYTPLPQARKRPTKAIIDVAVDRLGMTVGGGLTMLVLLWTTAAAQRSLIGLTIAASLAALFVAIRLHEGYVASLAESLRTGAVKLEPEDVVDATNRKTLWETNVAITREKLLQELGVLRQSVSKELGPPVVGAPEASAERADAVVKATIDLRSRDLSRARHVLRSPEPLDPLLVPHVIPLLAREELLTEASHALRSAAARCTGQLLDALLDPAIDAVVRRRLPRILQGAPSQRSADGLLTALDDELFEIRYRCALSLVRIGEKNPAVVFPRERVLAAARRELTRGSEVMKGQMHEPDDEAFVDDVLRSKADHHIETVFAILSLALDREPLKIAFRALNTDDNSLRGTALEYLDNVLPDAIREALRPYLGAHRPRLQRPKQQVMEELLKSNDTIALNLEALRKKKDGPPT